MTREELWNVEHQALVELADGAIGILCIVPTRDQADDQCGIQVPGEGEHRWMDAAVLEQMAPGMLREIRR